MPEFEIYNVYSASFPVKPKSNSVKLPLAKIFNLLAKIFFIGGTILVVIGFGPSLWYQIKSGGMQKISQFILNTAEVTPKSKVSPVKKPIKETYQPKFDPKLPIGQRIKIPSLKIDTVINEGTFDNYEEALKKGVWRVGDFGTPAQRDKPMILAAHRFGYLAWSIPYRLKNSFYSLPKLKIGDIVEITWNHRKYIYEVYDEGKGEGVEDYSADLILYTCESLNSPVRIFKYARLLEI